MEDILIAAFIIFFVPAFAALILIFAAIAIPAYAVLAIGKLARRLGFALQHKWAKFRIKKSKKR